MTRTLLSTLALGVAIVAAPADAAVQVTSTAANGSNHLAVAGSTVNMSFDNPAGTVAEAASKGLTATLNGVAGRTTVAPSGTTSTGVFVVTPNPYDGNGFFGIGGTANDGSQSFLTLMGSQAYSSISVFIGSLDAYNAVQLLDAGGNALGQAYSGLDMAGGTTLPFPGNTSAADNRRVTFTGTNGTVFYGAKFYNQGNTSAFEFDNVSFTASVPEPATWAMMICGFGMMGGAMRSRRRTSVSFA